MNTSVVDSRLAGTPLTRFFQELFSNSWHFPIANILLEFLLEKSGRFILDPALYSILTAGAIQAYFLSKWQVTNRPRRFLGNLIGVALYTAVEMLLEDGFFSSPNHIAYWFFSILIGVMQASRNSLKDNLADAAIVLEDVVRLCIIPVMYVVYEMKSNPGQTSSVQIFFSDSSHIYVTTLAILLGLNIGLSSLTAHRFLELLRQTSRQLKTYSEWLLGRDLLGRIIDDPTALQLRRHERTVLFMDIRGFTRWSEPRTPEEVVTLLDHYYQTAEAALLPHRVIKVKYAADEVLAIFPAVDDALQAAFVLRQKIALLLERHEIGAGIGIHVGPVVEGLVGSKDVKFYDVIGDTVNTAKRIESQAGAGELLVSETVRLALGQSFRVGNKQQVVVKGKDEPVIVYPIL